MSLTKSDLEAIKKLVDTSVGSSEVSVIKRIDELDDALSLQMEHGLEELRVQFRTLGVTVDQIALTQQAEIERVDKQSSAIQKLRKALNAA